MITTVTYDQEGMSVFPLPFFISTSTTMTIKL